MSYWVNYPTFLYRDRQLQRNRKECSIKCNLKYKIIWHLITVKKPFLQKQLQRIIKITYKKHRLVTAVEFYVSSAKVWVHPQLPQQNGTLRDWLRKPRRQHSPKTQTEHLYVSKNSKLKERKISWKRTKKNSPVFLPQRKPWPHPQCRRAVQRSGPLCIFSLYCRWPPAVLLGSLCVSLHLLCLSQCGLLPTETTIYIGQHR